MNRACPYCEGLGCEECDGTGRRYRQTWTTADGQTVSVTGSGEFDPASRKAFEQIAALASEWLETTQPGRTSGLKERRTDGSKQAHR